MSDFVDVQDPPMSPAAIAARLLGVDLNTAALYLSQIQPIARPVGLSLVGCITVQDARQVLGIVTPPGVKIAAYTFNH